MELLEDELLRELELRLEETEDEDMLELTLEELLDDVLPQPVESEPTSFALSARP
jgi:hypothetical protein